MLWKPLIISLPEKVMGSFQYRRCAAVVRHSRILGNKESSVLKTELKGTALSRRQFSGIYPKERLSELNFDQE